MVLRALSWVSRLSSSLSSATPRLKFCIPVTRLSVPLVLAGRSSCSVVAKPLPYSLLGAYKAPFDSKKLLGAQIEFKTFDSDVKRGSAVVEFATQTNTVDGVLYSLYVDADSFNGRPNSNKIRNRNHRSEA